MEPSSFGVILVSVITFVWLVYSTIVTSKMPQSLPWAGVRKEVLSKTRANIRELTAGLRTLKMGYNQVSASIPITLALLTAPVYSLIERDCLM